MKRTVNIAQSFGVLIPVIAIVACITTAIIAQEDQPEPSTAANAPVKQSETQDQDAKKFEADSQEAEPAQVQQEPTTVIPSKPTRTLPLPAQSLTKPVQPNAFVQETLPPAKVQKRFPVQRVPAPNTVRKLQPAQVRSYSREPQQLKNQPKTLPQVYRPQLQTEPSYVYSAGAFSDPGSATRKIQAAKTATASLTKDFPNHRLTVQATNDFVRLTGFAIDAEQSRRIELIVRDKVKSVYSESEPESIVKNLLSVSSKPVILVSSLVVQQTGEVDWNDDFLKNKLFGALTRSTKNPILTLSAEREVRVRAQMKDPAFEIIARPQIRVQSASPGSLQVSLGGKVLSLAVTVTGNHSTLKYSVKGGVLTPVSAPFKSRTIISEQGQAVFVLLESPKESPIFAILKSKIFKDIDPTIPPRQQPAYSGYDPQKSLPQSTLAQPLRPQPSEWVAVNPTPAGLQPPSDPLPPAWSPGPSYPRPYVAPHPPTPTPVYPINTPLHRFGPQNSYAANPNQLSPYAWNPSVVPLNCMSPTRSSLLTKALANLEGANCPELAKLVRIELKKAQIQDIKTNIERQQAHIKSMEQSIAHLEASIRRLDSDSGDQHTLDVKVLRAPSDHFQAIWKKLDPKQEEPLGLISIERDDFVWRRTIKKEHAQPIIEAFSKTEGVKKTVSSSVLIRGNSAIAKDGLSVSAKRLSPHVTVVQVSSAPGNVRLVNQSVSKPTMSIALGDNELALLTKTHADGSVSLLVIGTHQAHDKSPISEMP